MRPNWFRVDQVGFVVASLDEALPAYDRIYGGGPWRAWTYGPRMAPQMSYYGQKNGFSMRLALNSESPVQVELIEPLDGSSIYTDFLNGGQQGMHHLGMFVEDLAEAVDAMTGAGFAVIQTGSGYGLSGDGGFAYFDSAAEVGAILEVIEVPASRRPPEAVFADGAWSTTLAPV